MDDRLLIRVQGWPSLVLRRLRKVLRWLVLLVPELAPTIQHRRFLTSRPSTARPTEGATKEERNGRYWTRTSDFYDVNVALYQLS